MNLYVGNLEEAVTEEDLQANFEQAGSVISVVIATDIHTGLSRGFGYVEMGSDDEAGEAIRLFHNKKFRGKTMKVMGPTPKAGGSGRKSGAPRKGAIGRPRIPASHRFHHH